MSPKKLTVVPGERCTDAASPPEQLRGGLCTQRYRQSCRPPLETDRERESSSWRDPTQCRPLCNREPTNNKVKRLTYYKHTHTHARMHSHTHMLTFSCAHARTHTQTRACKCTHTCIPFIPGLLNTHTHTHPHTKTHKLAHMRTSN